MSDALLAASILVRGAHHLLNAAIRADGPTSARLAALHNASPPTEQPDSRFGSAEPSLCFVSTNPWSPGVDRLSMVLTADGVDLRLQDPVPARATLHADNSSLLALLRTPDILTDTTRFQVDGDTEFAIAVLAALRSLRPDLLLPLSDLVGSALPSAMHTARAAAGDLMRGVLSALRPRSAPPAAPAAPPAAAPAGATRRPPPGAATAAADARVDDPNGAT